MTLDELEAISSDTISVETAAAVLGQDAQSIRDQAQYNPKMLGYPVIVTGRRVKIPRIPFINYLRGITVIRLDDQTVERLSIEVAKRLKEMSF